MTVLDVKRNDIGIFFSDVLTMNSEPIDLTDADEVLFLLRATKRSVALIQGVATIDNDPATGRVTYRTVDGDTATSAIYRQEWEVTFTSGERITVPSVAYNEVRIGDDLNPIETE